MLSLKQSHSHDIYLGIPMNSTKSNKEALLEVVIERIKDGWKMEVYNVPCLIKSVGTALPYYPMPSRNFLQSVCTKINTMLRDFQWGKQGSKGKVYSIGFDSKSQMEVWSIEESSSIKILKAKYLRTNIFRKAKTLKSISWHQRSIISGRDLLRKGSCIKMAIEHVLV